jgi:hypothetical protein
MAARWPALGRIGICLLVKTEPGPFVRSTSHVFHPTDKSDPPASSACSQVLLGAMKYTATERESLTADLSGASGAPQKRRRRSGRPELPAGDRRSHRLDVCLTARELEHVMLAARAAGLPLRAYARLRLIRDRAPPNAQPMVFRQMWSEGAVVQRELDELCRQLAQLSLQGDLQPQTVSHKARHLHATALQISAAVKQMRLLLADSAASRT